jgi:haloalkane dehalogenase
MNILRTPDERFARLPDWPFAPRYVEINGAHADGLNE